MSKPVKKGKKAPARQYVGSKQAAPRQAATIKSKRRSPWIAIGVIIAMALLGVVYGIGFIKEQQSTAARLPKEISIAQALEKRDAGAVMLDVREPSEWEEYHMPGATLIPLGELQSRVDELPRDQEIVVVCRSGNRSAQGRDILLDAGFAKVTSMAGGMSEWRAAGYPVETGP